MDRRYGFIGYIQQVVKRIGVLVFLSALLLPVSPSHAYTVAGAGKGGFADFSKAVVFTGLACPSNAETIATNTGAKTCAIPLKPVGDGSWVCTVSIFPGTNYQYYFEYRIPLYEDTAGWKNAPAGGNRNQDPTRDVTVPTTASDGYIFYHVFGDKDVRGRQGIARQGAVWDTELTPANPDIAKYRGVDDVDNTGDGDTGNLDGNNNYSMGLVQQSDTRITLRWVTSHGGDGFAPTIEGAREFDTTSAATPYGFKILRARLSSSTGTSPITNLIFEDTVVNQVTGDTFWSPNRTTIAAAWYGDAMSFTDTSLPANTAVGDSFVYTVIWQDAYGNRSDTVDQNFSGGSASWVRGAKVETLFLVEKFDPTVVFPRGAPSGRIRITPYVNGVPQPWNAFWTSALIVRGGG